MNTITTISTWTGIINQFLFIFIAPGAKIFSRLLNGCFGWSETAFTPHWLEKLWDLLQLFPESNATPSCTICRPNGRRNGMADLAVLGQNYGL